MDTELQQLAKTDRNPVQETRYQQLLKGQGGTGDNTDLTGEIKNSQNNFNNLVSSNTKAVTDFLGNYKTDTQSAMTNAGVPQFQNLVTGLNSRISDLASNSSNSGGGSVGNTGAGGYSNANQVDTAISSRYLPQLNAAEQNLGTSLNSADMALQPDKAYGSLLANNISTAMAGLDSTQSSILSAVLGKLNAGVSLTETEMKVGEDAAQQALDRAQQMTLAKLSASYTPIASGSAVMNPTTGQIINPYLLATQNGGSYTP